jgi:hypothetical protein
VKVTIENKETTFIKLLEVDLRFGKSAGKEEAHTLIKVQVGKGASGQ